MKTYNEMANDVFARRDAYVAQKKVQHRHMATAAGCLCLAAVLGVGVVRLYGGPISGEPDPDSTYVMKHAEQTETPWLGEGEQSFVGRVEGSLDGGTVAGGRVESLAGGSDLDGDPAGYYATYPGGEQVPSHEDLPADPNGEYVETVDIGGGDWYGGRYLDESGHVVVLLTSTSPENIALAYKFDPSIPDDAIFKTANYCMRDLNAIQAKISDAMTAGDLPFVVMSALVESENIVRVTVVSPTDEQLALLKRFDPLDGAVQIVYGSGAVSNAVARVEPIYESVDPVGAIGG